MERVLRHRRAGAPPAPPDWQAVGAFHRSLPGYRPTPLLELPDLAKDQQVGRLLVKLETDRFGLPSFKALGASWAAARVVGAWLGHPPDHPPPLDLGSMAAEVARRPQPPVLLAATDGNHGRAVAWVARYLGAGARIYVPADMAIPRIAAIVEEGAAVVVITGSYEEAVAATAGAAGPDRLVVSDTSWPGYETIPRWVSDGYATIFTELAAQLAELEARPEVLVVPVGVGALAAAAVAALAHQPVWGSSTELVAVEPTVAACVQASLRAGRLTEVPPPHGSSMSGLNCGLPSLVAWPSLRAGVDWAVAVTDDEADRALVDLARHGLEVGECGAAPLAGLRALIQGGHRRLDDAPVVLLATEGPTDPDRTAAVLAGVGPEEPRGESGSARSPQVAAFWSAFTAATGTRSRLDYSAWAFGSGEDSDLADRLSALVLAGTKRATTGVLEHHRASGEPLPRVGDHGVILDGRGEPVCIIRTAHVEVRRFGDVDAAFARREGESDRSLGSWRRAHRRFFGRQGFEIEDGTPVVLEEFELVWPAPGSSDTGTI